MPEEPAQSRDFTLKSRNATTEAVSKAKSEKFLTSARRALAEERYADAVRHYEKLLRIAPNVPVVLIESAHAFTRSGHFDTARRLLQRMESALALHPDFLVPVATGYFAIGDYQKSRDLLGRRWREGDRSPETGIALVETAERMGDWDEADRILGALNANDPRANLFRGILKTRRDDHEAASELLERSMREARDGATLLRAGLLLAVCRERQGRYREAWERMVETRKSALPENALATRLDAEDRELTEQVEHQFAQDEPPAPSSENDPNDPILLAGHPRSGNSVVAVHLAARRGLADIDEIGAFSWALEKGKLAGKTLRQISVPELTRARKRYFEQMRQMLPGELHGQRWLDKNPGLELFGLHWLAMFPGSEIVLVRRTPLDCMVSCLFTYLPLNSFSLQFFTPERAARSLHRSLRAQERLLELRAGRVSVVSYESFVKEMKGQSVEVEDQEKRPVLHSPNYATARKAVHLRSVARAEHYKEFFPREIIRDFE